MKRISYRMQAAILTFCGAMMMLTACTDTIGTADNPVKPEQPGAVEELAKETFIHEAWMDRTTKPGDSFWQFALGSWLKNRDILDPGALYKAGDALADMLVHGLADYPTPNHTMQLIFGPRPSVEEQQAVLESVLAQLKDGDDISKADLIRNIGKAADLGLCAFMGHDVACIDGTFKYYIMPGFVSDAFLATATKEQVELFIKNNIQKYFGMNVDDPKEAKLISDVAEIDYKILKLKDEWMYSSPRPALIGRGRSGLKSTPVPAATFFSRAQSGQSTGNDDIRAAFREAFHIDNQTYYLPEVDKIFEIIDQYDVASLQLYLKYYLIKSISSAIVSPEDEQSSIYVGISAMIPSMFLDYHQSILLKDADCEGALQLLEELRELFAQRIRNLDWLSDATKAKALEKLKLMGFKVGGPQKQVKANFKLTGKTPVEDVLQYKQQADEYLRNELAGKPGGEYEWEYLLLSPNGTSLDATNAFYDPLTNQLVILPVFLQGELFPADKNSVMRYATLVCFGHEMTHGFDGMGAGYDAEGKLVDWWTAEDKAKFLQRQQMTVERYNELEQVPGIPANGEKTKNENIADLGGFNLAWELWNRKLKADGLTGEPLRHQQRQFFLEYAHFWQLPSTEQSLKDQLEIDPHSANHNRVNGVVRLIDDWYTLFGVEPGDKLYVKPEDRVKIW